ncbi:MAG: hypothetical protein ACFFAO_15365 [Candidatus Hermodarchaeota archaeon]
MIFIIAVFIAFSLLIVHSLIFRGIKETATFFGFGFIFGLIREIVYRTYFRNYSFGEVPLQILGAPVAIIFGWIFTFYLGYSLCEKFLVNDESESEYMRLMVLCAIFSSYICFSIETTAMHAGWWIVYFESSEVAASDLLAGWFYTTLIFFSIYFILIGKVKRIKNLILPILLILLIAIIEFMEQILIVPEEILVIIIYFTILVMICFLYPYLAVLMLMLAFLFFIYPIRIIFTNDIRIFTFFVVGFGYMYLILKKPEMFEYEIINIK